jgi:hypothetical protein
MLNWLERGCGCFGLGEAEVVATGSGGCYYCSEKAYNVTSGLIGHCNFH